MEKPISTNRKDAQVELFDTSLRDGAQSLPNKKQFPPDAKPALADAIARLGVTTIEAGFPGTEHDGQEVADVAETVGRTRYVITPRTIEDGELMNLPPREFTPIITGLARAVPSEIEQTWQAVSKALRPGIHVFVATAAEHMQVKHKDKSKTEILAMAQAGIRHARAISSPNTQLEFSCEAASTTDMPTLEQFVRMALNEDVNVINLPDTLGAASPRRMGAIFRAVTQWVHEEGRHQEVTISSHNHDDGARAVENTISSLHAVIDTANTLGIDPPTFQVEGVVTPGLGERNGNTFLAPFVRDVLTDRDEFRADILMYVDTKRILRTAKQIAEAARLKIDPNAPVVGSETRKHRSGVHSDAIIKGGAAVYAAVNPVWFGHPNAAELEDGKFQGNHGRQHLGTVDTYRLTKANPAIAKRIESMGLHLSTLELGNITQACSVNALRLKRPVTDTELEAFAAEVTAQDLTDSIKTVEFRERTADNSALVLLNCDGIDIGGVAQHTTGNISALIHAANNALRFDGDIRDFEAHALTDGADATASVSFTVVQNGYEISTSAEGENVDAASLNAYIRAVNLIKRTEKRLGQHS